MMNCFPANDRKFLKKTISLPTVRKIIFPENKMFITFLTKILAFNFMKLQLSTNTNQLKKTGNPKPLHISIN